MEPHKYDNKTGLFLVYDNYIIVEPKFDVDVYKKEVELLNDIVSKHINGDFGLIENRVNRNSINPQAYSYAKELMPNFTAFALVVYTDMAKKHFEMESYFINDSNIKHKMFPSLVEAKEWMCREV